MFVSRYAGMYLFSLNALRLVVSWEVVTVALANLRALLMNSTLQQSVPSLVKDVQESQDSIDSNGRLNCILVATCMVVSYNLVTL